MCPAFGVSSNAYIAMRVSPVYLHKTDFYDDLTCTSFRVCIFHFTNDTPLETTKLLEMMRKHLNIPRCKICTHRSVLAGEYCKEGITEVEFAQRESTR